MWSPSTRLKKTLEEWWASGTVRIDSHAWRSWCLVDVDDVDQLNWRRRRRLGFLSDTRFSSSGGLYYLYLRGIYSFLFSINYVSICKSQYWYRTSASWILFHVSRLDQTASSDERWYTPRRTIHFYISIPPGATCYILPSRSSTLDHPKASLFLDNYWRIKIRQSNDFLYTNVMWVSVGHFKNVLINKFSCLLVTDSWTPHPHAFWFLHPQNFCLYIL